MNRPSHAPTAANEEGGDRPLWTSIFRGTARRCPKCGEAPLYRSYLKPHGSCGACGLDFSGHRADDLPPYLTILITAHLLVPALVALEKTAPPPMWVGALLWSTVAVLLCVVLLPIVKGGVIGLQWALRMHGFDDGPPAAPDRISDPQSDLS